MSDDPYADNRAWWDERAAFHLATDFYGRLLKRLEAGGHCLLPREEEELGELGGLDVLHLQCHVGTDTCSLARLGARVTGVDFSEVAIDEATGLAARLGVDARFVQAEIADVGDRFAGQFDLVYTSQGVLSWLADLDVWAAAIGRSLRPGGRLYLLEMHPFAYTLDDEEDRDGAAPLRLRYPYLHQEHGLVFTDGGSYADRERQTQANITREWAWGLGDVVGALLGVGMRLEWLREHPESFYPLLPCMTEGEDGHFRLPTPLHGQFPLTFSLMAHKPG